MKRNRCRRRRPDICLMASDALGGEEKAELQGHLAVCQECRGYYAEITAVTTPLADWEQNLSAIEVTPAERMRWAKAVSSVPNLNPNPQRARLRLGAEGFCRIVWCELIRPNRFAWTGMAAIWLVMLAVDGGLSDHRMIEADARIPSTHEILQAWEEQNRVLAELTQPGFVAPAAPSVVPRPRSERERDWEII